MVPALPLLFAIGGAFDYHTAIPMAPDLPIAHGHGGGGGKLGGLSVRLTVMVFVVPPAVFAIPFVFTEINRTVRNTTATRVRFAIGASPDRVNIGYCGQCFPWDLDQPT